MARVNREVCTLASLLKSVLFALYSMPCANTAVPSPAWASILYGSIVDYSVMQNKQKTFNEMRSRVLNSYGHHDLPNVRTLA